MRSVRSGSALCILWQGKRRGRRRPKRVLQPVVSGGSGSSIAGANIDRNVGQTENRDESMAALGLLGKVEFVVGNKYRLMRKIGSGSFGDIYLGINITNGEVSTRRYIFNLPPTPSPSSIIISHTYHDTILRQTTVSLRAKNAYTRFVLSIQCNSSMFSVLRR